MTNEQKKNYIAALLRERAGAVKYGRDDTVAQIDAQLVQLGHKAAPPAKRASRMTAPKRTEL